MSIQELKETLKAQYGDTEKGEAYFQVFGPADSITVAYDITFRRNTMSGAMRQYSRDRAMSNAIIQQIAEQYQDQYRVTVGYPSPPQEDEYSEYEQSFGGFVTIKEM